MTNPRERVLDTLHTIMRLNSKYTKSWCDVLL